MQVRLVLLLAAAGAVAIVEHNEIAKLWDEIYPADEVRQTALGRCYSEDHNFNRLNAEARSACYQKWIQTMAISAGATPTLRAPNAVDLAHIVGAGQLPKNDIRRGQATEAYRDAPEH